MDKRDKQTFVIGVICTVIGVLIGVLISAIPKSILYSQPMIQPQSQQGQPAGVQVPDIGGEGRPIFQQAQEQGGKPIPMGVTGPYPGSQLIDAPLIVMPREAKVIRDFLKKEEYTGKWIELEWKRITGKPPRPSPFGMIVGENDACVTLQYKTMSRAGTLEKVHIHAIFYEDGSVTIAGGPLIRLQFHNIPKPAQPPQN